MTQYTTTSDPIGSIASTIATHTPAPPQTVAGAEKRKEGYADRSSERIRDAAEQAD